MGGHQRCRSEASHKACSDAHRPTGTCNTHHIIPPHRIWAVWTGRATPTTIVDGDDQDVRSVVG